MTGVFTPTSSERSPRRARWASPLLALAAVPAIARAAMAAEYGITVIADTTRMPGFERLGNASISNTGTVSFIGSRVDKFTTRQTLFVHRDGQRVPIAETGDGYYQRIWSRADLNDVDVAAFAAEVVGVGEAIIVHDGTAARQIYPSGTAPFTYLREPPRHNVSGQVAFRSIPPGSPSTSGAYVGNGVVTRTVAERSQPTGGVTVPDVNNAGQVAYRVAEGRNRIWVDTGGVKTLVAESGVAPFRGMLDDPVINDAGMVAFVGYDGFDGAGGSGVYVGDGGPLRTVVDSAGPLGSFGPYVGINDHGRVAFVAWVDGGGFETGGSGIYTGPDVVADKVIAEGDPLDGATVTRVYLHGAINDAGQIAFEYTLSNGAIGVAVATPVPEPLAAAGLTCVGLAVLGLRRRRS